MAKSPADRRGTYFGDATDLKSADRRSELGIVMVLTITDLANAGSIPLARTRFSAIDCAREKSGALMQSFFALLKRGYDQDHKGNTRRQPDDRLRD